MVEVIGPVDKNDWNVMLSLRKNIHWYTVNNEEDKYTPALTKERNYYRNMVRTLPRKAA